MRQDKMPKSKNVIDLRGTVLDPKKSGAAVKDGKGDMAMPKADKPSRLKKK